MIDNRTLAAIHVAKKDIRLEDDDYRAMLRSEGGVDSARDLDPRGAGRVMLWFENHGFKRDARKGTSGDRRPIVLKARALWISLYQLDEVGNRRDQALDAFAKRITGKETLRFATNGEAGKVVEALKAWLGRVGVKIAGPDGVAFEQERRLKAHHERDGAKAEPSRQKRLHELSGKQLHAYVAALGVDVRRLKLGTRHHTTSQTEGASIG